MSLLLGVCAAVGVALAVWGARASTAGARPLDLLGAVAAGAGVLMAGAAAAWMVAGVLAAGGGFRG